MICEDCKWEADTQVWLESIGQIGATPKYNEGHAVCKGGTHCFCQHKEVGSHGDYRTA